MKRNPLYLMIASALLISQAVYGQDEETDGAETETVDRIVVTGTRVAGRTATDTAVPVDVIDARALENAGTSELNEALSTALPSFNFPRPGLADGTDTIRPATLRGLGPDQTLVLVNSKRRHTAALVNVNGTIGRGSAAVDLNTIPMGAVGSLEVLRDGASAQYGSDAIAGVINVLLREANSGGSLRASYGARVTEYTTPTTPPPAGATWSAPENISRSLTDGQVLTVGGWSGFRLGDNGFLTLSFEYKDQARTERSGWDYRQQYPLVNGQFDPREQTFDRFNAWYGEPEMEQLTLFANMGIDLDNGGRIYGWASYMNRDALSAGFYRRALDGRNVIEIYPDGFLPQINPEVDDFSAAFGYAAPIGSWDFDTSLVYGMNEVGFTIQNTLNASIGPSSKTVFDAGGYDYEQLVFNASAVRSVDVGGFHSPLNIAVGVEARTESYDIKAGEPDSWRNGGRLLPSGAPAASGSQVFPGFRPENEVSEDRTAIGAYIDFEAELTEKLLGSAAVRLEDYSDFGSNVSGKAALRYDFTDNFALRGSIQNGFRAPSLQQQYFTATSTNFINGVPFDITTFPAEDPVALALGSSALDSEESINFSLGAVIGLGWATLTIDAYQIDVDDRIVLSENLTQANVRQYLEDQGFIGIGGGRFFINGVDTRTQGVDAVLSWSTATTSAGVFDFVLAGNYNKTEVQKVPSTVPLEALDPSPVLFNRANVLTFESGNPRTKFTFNTNWTMDRWGGTLRARHYGRVLSPSNNPTFDINLTSKVLFDIEGRFDVTEQLQLAFGADNVLDEYPDASPIRNNTTGNTPFSNYSPFGRSGRFIYGRVVYNF
ncbi:MAG: TonB-dependent receptor [Wenzhouxiangella sp.]|jgi:iron complex outermembrane receptor protein|nr:TonB-dependent receptor [Wenzhouxiangella sp.]